MTTLSTDVLQSLGLSRPNLTQAANNDELGQEDFLRLMSVQLEGQDPLKPMENGDFIAQMAQFSSLTGIQDLSASFGVLAKTLTQNQTLQAASLVGKQVLVPTEFGMLSAQEPLAGAVELTRSARQVRIQVLDGSGQTVRDLDVGTLSAGLHDFTWDGLLADGTPAPEGVYQFRAIANGASGVEGLELFMNAPVDSVGLGNGQSLTLNVRGTGEVDFNDIRRIGS
jgi:flagellar basal-body rod modification protein FlgD